MTKEAVHADYLMSQKLEHGNKEQSLPHNALVIGAAPENIGQAIADRMRSSNLFLEVMTPDGDIDVRVADEWSVFFSRYATLDTLVMSHGYTAMNWIEDIEDWDLDTTIDTNLKGTILGVREFVRSTIDDPWRKRIIIIGSMAHNHVLNASSVYCASKAAVAHFVRCAGWELTPKGYDVFCVHPSNTEGTPMTDRTIEEIMRYRGMKRQEAEAYWGSINLMPRWLLPQDIGEVVYWLATNESASFLSGTQIELPGGQR